MTTAIETRPLAIWRRDSADSAIGASAAVNSGVAPAYGWGAISVFMRCPGGAGTLTIEQRLRRSSTWVTTDTFALGAAGVVSDVAVRTGELVRLVFTNGGTQQTPEILVGLE